MSPDATRARRLVEARLGRAPQDALEAAVVLEAWAGVPAQRALETARQLMPRRAAEPLASVAVPAITRRPPGLLVEGLAFLVSVVAIALWAQPLADSLGGTAVERALRLALPMTLALQWGLRARHLGRPSGLAGLARERRALAAGAALLVAGSGALLGEAGVLAALLTVTWTGGAVLIRRGASAFYATAVTAATVALLAGAPGLVAVAGVAALVVAAGAWALRGAAGAVAPGRWSRTLGAALIGAGVGTLLAGDPTVTWTTGSLGALALLPSAAGGLWAGLHLWKLAPALPRALTGVPAIVPSSPRGDVAAARTAGSSRGATTHSLARTLVGAAGRLVAVTAAGSLALVAVGGGPAGVLIGFGVVALASLLVGLLDSLGRPAWAGWGVAAGVGAEFLVRLASPFPGAALTAGGAVALAVLAPAAIVLLARPARTLATALWIT